MKKIVNIIILCVVLSVHSVFAQFGNLFSSANQQLIRDAVENGFFIVRQYYQLQDTTAERPSYFGRQGNPYFGHVYTLAVKGGPGYYADGKIVEPWMYDEAFEDFRGSVKFVPVLFKTERRELEEKTYTPFVFRPDSCEVLPEGTVYAVSDRSAGKGFRSDTVAGPKNGWIVLATTEKALEECDSAEITLEVYREKVEVPPGKTFCAIKTPSTTRRVLGGIYIQPEVTAPGQIVFGLVGFVGESEGKWGVAIPGKRVVAMTGGAENLLTPVPAPATTEPEVPAAADANRQKKDRKRR